MARLFRDTAALLEQAATTEASPARLREFAQAYRRLATNTQARHDRFADLDLENFSRGPFDQDKEGP